MKFNLDSTNKFKRIWHLLQKEQRKETKYVTYFAKDACITTAATWL